MKHLSIQKVFSMLVFTCAGILAEAQNTCMNPVIISSLPYSSGNVSTCGAGDDYSPMDLCAGGDYGTGEDYVFQLEVNETLFPASYTYILGGTMGFKSMTIHSACPATMGNCLGAITTGPFNLGVGSISFNANGTYYLIIDNDAVQGGLCGQFSLTLTKLPAQLLNDECPTATEIISGPNCVPVIGTTNTATDENEPGQCQNMGDENDVWFGFTATAATQVVTVQGIPGFDAIIGAQVVCGTPGRPDGGDCVDDFDDGEAERLILTNLTVGEYYYVQVQDAEHDNFPISLFTICVSDPLPNDQCANATDLGTAPTVVSGNLSAATDEGVIAKPSCDLSTSGTPVNDMWYRFTTNETGGNVTITLSNTTFDGILSVYGGCAPPVMEIACIDQFIFFPEVIQLTNLPPGTTYYIRVSGYNGDFGSFTLSINGTALPVELKSFTGKAVESENILYWSVLTERNVAHYSIERSTDAAVNWQQIGRQESDNSLNGEYVFMDENPPAVGYYRLRTSDIDGREVVSDVVTIIRESDRFQVVSALPNPAADMLKVVCQVPAEADAAATVLDMNGRRLQQQSYSFVKGLNTIHLDVTGLPSGTYLLQLAGSGGELNHVRFVKK